jgi:hypothetical protein
VPPPPPQKGARPIAVAAAVGLGAVLGVLGFLAISDDDGDGDGAAEVVAEPDDDTTTSPRDRTTTTTSTTTTTVATAPDLSDLPDPGGPVVTSGDLSLQLPAEWVGTDLSTGTEGAGAAMFPDNPAAAAAVQSQLDLMPRAVRIFGFDGAAFDRPTQFAANVNVIVDPSASAGIPMDEQLALQRRGLGAVVEVEDARVVQLGGREVGRIRSTFGTGGASYDVLTYLVDTGDELIVLTYSFGGLDAALERLADASAATFSAG